jgi:hypothetical protein
MIVALYPRKESTREKVIWGIGTLLYRRICSFEGYSSLPVRNSILETPDWYMEWLGTGEEYETPTTGNFYLIILKTDYGFMLLTMLTHG